MKILSISGSSRAQSSNSKLLDSLPSLFDDKVFSRYENIDQLPLFKAEDDNAPWVNEVLDFREAVATADAVIICIPEYIHNMPALIKNALEWLTTSGELMGKPVLPITFTPHVPRGEKAMQSLIWSLQALDTRIVTQLALYQRDITFDNDKIIANNEVLEMLKTAIDLLDTFTR